MLDRREQRHGQDQQPAAEGDPADARHGAAAALERPHHNDVVDGEDGDRKRPLGLECRLPGMHHGTAHLRELQREGMGTVGWRPRIRFGAVSPR